MNKVILIGRLTKDPDVRTTSNQAAFCNFTIAVDRKFKDQNGQRQADFINCIAWRQTATFIGNYFRKGSKIAVVGSLQTRTYDDNQGQKRYVTEVVVDEVEFADSANSAQKTPNGGAAASNYQQPAPSMAQPVPVAVPVATQQVSAPVNQVPQAPQAPQTSIEPDSDAIDFVSEDGSLPFDI